MKDFPSGAKARYLCAFHGRTEQAAEKVATSGEMGQKHSSGAEAHADSVGLLRGLKPPPPSELRFSAACKARYLCAFDGTAEDHPSDEDLSPGTPVSRALSKAYSCNQF
jgi:hypothetical protein